MCTEILSFFSDFHIYPVISTATSPITLDATTGALACPTCGAISSIAGNTGAFTLGNGLANTVNALRVWLSSLTNSLGADVLLNNTANYFDGPSIAQCSTGTWFASGTVTLNDSATAVMQCKLWDGTTVIASAEQVINRAALDAAGGGGGSFAGPGDAKALTAWWGVIAYSAASAGTKAIQLCDSAGANCADVNTDAVTGVLSAPGTRGADNCSVVSTCKVKTIYDKVGTLDLTQATAGNMPTLTPSALGSCYGITFTAANSTELNSGATNPGTSTIPVSSVLVAKNPAAAAQYGLLSLDTLGYAGIIIDWNTTPQIDTYNGASIQASASANAWHAIQVVSNTTSSVIRVDSTDSTGLSGGTQGIPASATVRLGQREYD